MANVKTQTGELNNAQLSSLLDFAQKLNGLRSVDDIAWETVCYIARYLEVEDCIFYAMHVTKPCLVQLAAYGPHKSALREILNPIEIQLGSGIVGTVAQTGQGEKIADTRLDPRYIVDDAPRLSEMAVPIISRGRVFGVIDTEHPDLDHYTDAQFAYVNLITQQVAPVLASVLLEQRLNSTDFARHASTSFLRVMQHNTMTPLSVTLMKAQILNHGIYGDLSDKQQQAVGQIIESTRAVTGMLQDVFEYVRLDSGNLPLVLSKTTAQAVEADVARKLSPLLQAARIRVMFVNRVPQSPIQIDHGLVVKAILRICQVASQDMHQNDQLLITFQRSAHELVVEVQNYLPAISRAKLQTMLRPFGNIRDDQENGLTSRHGLELILAQQSLRLHRGELEISNLENSNLFVIRIPL